MFKAMAWGGLALGMACASAHAAVDAQLFDPPMHKQTLPLPPDPLNPQTKPTLSCFYYPHLMVKQVDLGEKGAAQLSVLLVPSGQGQPACRRENATDETVIAGWSGYFRGVRAGYVFLDGDDGWNGGGRFAVFGPYTRRIVFNDVAAQLHAVEVIRLPQPPDQRPSYENLLALRYRREYQAPCSLRANARQCWSLIRRATGLTQVTGPDCSASYLAQEKHAPPGRLAEVRADPSVIEYDVETVLDSQGVIRLVPVSSALVCRAAE